MQQDFRNNRRLYFEGAFLTVMTLFFAVVGISFRPALIIMNILASLPVSVAVVRWGRKLPGIMLGVVLLALMLITGPVQSFQFLLSFSIPGIIIGLLIKRKDQFSSLLTVSTLSFAVSFIAVGWLGILLRKGSIVEDYIIKGLKEGFYRILDFYLGLMPFKVESLQQGQMVESLTSQYSPFIPAGLIILLLLVTYIDLLLLRGILKMMHVDIIPYKGVSSVYLPKGVNFALVISFLLLFMGGMGQAVELALANVMILVLFAYAIQGISLLEHYFLKYGVSVVLKIIIYTILLGLLALISLISFVIPPFGLFSPLNLLIFLGIIDNSFNIRKRDLKEDCDG